MKSFELGRRNRTTLAVWAEKLTGRRCAALMAVGARGTDEDLDLTVCVVEGVSNERLIVMLEELARQLRAAPDGWHGGPLDPYQGPTKPGG